MWYTLDWSSVNHRSTHKWTSTCTHTHPHVERSQKFMLQMGYAELSINVKQDGLGHDGYTKKIKGHIKFKSSFIVK